MVQQGSVQQTQEQGQSVEAADALAQSRIQVAQALQEVRLAREELESANRVKDRFLAALSHELRTPLTPIVIAVRILARRADISDSEREAIEVIRRNVKIESNLIDDLLDLTRISHGKFDIDLEPVDVHAAISGAVEICEPEIRHKNQRLIVSLEASRYRIEGDFARLQQVVRNLLKNASKFTREGGEIRVSSRSDDGSFVLTVSDNGIGMERAALPTVFDAFSQGDEWMSRKFGGLGLSLALAKATVESHGGTIEAQSEGRGRGATLLVELPLG